MNRRRLFGWLPALLMAPLVAREKEEPFTPTWTPTSTAPALGNGTIVGTYVRLPRIYGDGIHDDGPAIQARIDQFGTARLGPGVFLIGAPLSLGKNGSIVGSGADSTVLRHITK